MIAVHANTPGTELAQVISRVVRSLSELSGLPVSFGGPVAEDRGGFVISDLAGTTTGSLRRLRVASGLGLGGKALAMARPATVSDYLNARGITHRYDRAVAPERLFSVMAVPITVDRRPRAVVYTATRDGMPLGERLLGHIGPILRKAEHDLGVADEVRRRMSALDETVLESPRTAPRADLAELRAELAAIADTVTDEGARERLRGICDRIGPGPTQEPGTGGISLSPRERDVLRYVSVGQTNDQIAAALGLLPNTVKSYVKTAVRKLDARNRTHAAYLAREAGLIPDLG